MNKTNGAPYIGIFLVGAYKCGTTTVADWLFQHPQITSCRADPVFRDHLACLPPRKNRLHKNTKEPSIMLTRMRNVHVDWKRGTVWENNINNLRRFDLDLARCLPDSPQTRPSHWKTLAADCSPFYFPRKNCAEAIKTLYSDARIIITLRHPTDYFHSLFCVDLRNFQGANRPILTDAVNKKINGLPSTDITYFWTESIQNWLSLFGKNQVKIIILEEWRERPEQTAQECYRFIDVDHSFVPRCKWLNSALAQGVAAPIDLYELRRKQLNVSGQDRQFYPVNYLARRHYRYCYTLFKKQKISSLRDKQNFIRKSPFRIFYSKRPPPLETKTRQKLDKHFKPIVEAMEKVLGRPIPCWHRA